MYVCYVCMYVCMYVCIVTSLSLLNTDDLNNTIKTLKFMYVCTVCMYCVLQEIFLKYELLNRCIYLCECMYVWVRFATRLCGRTEMLRLERNMFWIEQKSVLEVSYEAYIYVCMYVCMYYVCMYYVCICVTQYF